MYLRALPCVLVASALFACSDPGHPIAPPLPAGAGGASGAGGGASSTGGSGFDAGGPMGPPALDAGDLCGNQIHAITNKPPNVYFIFDISGSMSTPVPGGTRYSVVQAAAFQLVEDLRYVIRAGAAAFPLDPSGSDPCHPGGEIFPPTLDDPVGFAQATGALTPFGGTPTAATILGLVKTVSSLPGKTIAVLATDGGPNCNPDASCTVASCGENIDGCPPSDDCCALGTNCCAASGPSGPTGCVDEAASVAAVKSLHAAGVDVSVIGIPGSQAYGDVLSAMALAGGAPQPAAPFYYDVQDLSELGAILRDIATGSISCDITIADPPPTPDETNVYLDKTLLLSDPNNGWTWTASNVVTLHGTACAELKSGAVADVQVVSGCPTQATP